MEKKYEFFILLLEQYAAYKNESAAVLLTKWESQGLVDYINDMYEQYHIERLENAFADIDDKLLGSA